MEKVFEETAAAWTAAAGDCSAAETTKPPAGRPCMSVAGPAVGRRGCVPTIPASWARTSPPGSGGHAGASGEASAWFSAVLSVGGTAGYAGVRACTLRCYTGNYLYSLVKLLLLSIRVRRRVRRASREFSRSAPVTGVGERRHPVPLYPVGRNPWILLTKGRGTSRTPPYPRTPSRPDIGPPSASATVQSHLIRQTVAAFLPTQNSRSEFISYLSDVGQTFAGRRPGDNEKE